MKKDILTRPELLEIMSLLSGAETKLLSFNDFDRYLLGKFLIWIGEFGVVAEKLYDLLNKYEEETKSIEKSKKKVKLKERKLEFTRRTEFIEKQLKTGNKGMLTLQHDFKFLVTLFLYLSRSTLSLKAKAFESFTTNRMEYSQKLSEYDIAKKRGWRQ
ncbi:MAG: hypothetical protein V3U92_19615 [Cellulophaga sp.]